MVLEKRDGNFTKDRNIHVRAMCGVQVKADKFDVRAGFEVNYLSVGYGKQCLLAWPCVEERGWSSLEKGVRF